MYLMYGDSSSEDEDPAWAFNKILRRIRENQLYEIRLEGTGDGDDHYINNMTDEQWEDLGLAISNNTQLEEVKLSRGALNDHKMQFFFRRLTRSSSIQQMSLFRNGLSAVGVRSMVPFLQSASDLLEINLNYNLIQSEGFNTLLRALGDSTIKELRCIGCGIESIEIDSEHIPKHLKSLTLANKIINADGCQGLAKLLEGEDATLKNLSLDYNNIDDQGVNTLVDSLQKNRSLTDLGLGNNNAISDQGQIMLLKLVNNISSIKATLQSNHTLTHIKANSANCGNDLKKHIQRRIDLATQINAQNKQNPEAAGKAKVLQSQMNCCKRAELADLQGVNQLFVYSEIKPLHLPEVLALVRRYHGLGELYVALNSSIAGVISTVNRKECLKQQRAEHEAVIAEQRAKIAFHRAIIADRRTKVETIEAEIAIIEEADGSHIGRESRSSKRLRAS